MHWATTSVKKNDRAGLCAGMVMTLLLGSTFLLTQVIEYHRLGFNTAERVSRPPSSGSPGSTPATSSSAC